MTPPPIKRHESLQPFSREHHQGLLLCWKIREGFKQGIEPERIKHYTDWFWNNHLRQHFEAEEKYIFPILPQNDALIIQALEEHRELKRLFEGKAGIVAALTRIEQALNAHIRFEERVLFNKIQEAATPGQLKMIEAHHSSAPDCDNWDDAFWIRDKDA